MAGRANRAVSKRTMADPVQRQRASTDSGTSSKTTIAKTRGGKAAAAAVAAAQPSEKKPRRKGNSVSPKKKSAGSAGTRASAARASADRASVVADAPGGATEGAEQLLQNVGKKVAGRVSDAAAADRASVAAEAPQDPSAEEVGGEEGKPSSTEAAPHTAKLKRSEVAVADPSPAYLKAQAAMEQALAAEGGDGGDAEPVSATAIEGKVNVNTLYGAQMTQETADAALVAGDAAAEEECRLREEREAEAKKAAAAAQPTRVSKQQRWKKLDELLSRASLYSDFLSEQLVGDAQVLCDPVAEAETTPAAGSRKRGAGAQKGRAGKRKKVSAGGETASTQAMLPLIVGEMREYQLKGVRWLISLDKNGLNGILADEMGLGKTVQTIGFLSYLHSQIPKEARQPFLVLGPLSTLPNWMSEFKRWCPSMTAVMYHGDKEKRGEMRAGHLAPEKCRVDAIVTSYEIAMKDIGFLARHKFKYLVVDEGHRLKNFNSKLFRDLRQLQVQQKLLLTGTPLQNNLGELWSLLNFLLPDMFNSLSDFEQWFDFGDIEAEDADAAAAKQRDQVVRQLHTILKPFLLRRVKADVESNLPGKAEIILYADMSETQRRLNEELLNRTINETLAKDAAGMGGSGMARLNNMLMQMRKNANHPDLITGPFEQSIAYPPPDELIKECGKMQLLQRMLVKLHAEGHKVLIFSQMTKMLDLLHYYLEERGFDPCRIDGSIPWEERQADMKAFNEDPERFVFLLSTRAGGLGINLTSADTVIIYDSDWNPHADLQAMDRCHRIGQTRPVLVFRLATGNSIEGRMLARAASKLALNNMVIQRGAFVDPTAAKETAFGGDGLMELLRPAPEETAKGAPQSKVVDDKMLDRLMDRSFLEEGKKAPYAAAGPGWQVVAQMDSSGLLKGVE